MREVDDLKYVLRQKEVQSSATDLLMLMGKYGETSANMKVAIELLITIGSSIAGFERSFSKLKLIKTFKKYDKTGQTKESCFPEHQARAGLRGGATGQSPHAPRWKGALRDEIYLFQIKYSFEKICDSDSDTRIQLYIIFLCCVKYQGPPTAIDFSTSLTVCQS